MGIRDTELFDKVVQLLLPFMGTVSARQTELYPVLLGKPVQDRVQWEGTPRDFTVQLVRLLSADELLFLLKRLTVGLEWETEIEDVCARIEEEATLSRLDSTQSASIGQSQSARRVSIGCFPYPPVSTWTEQDGFSKGDKEGGPWTEIATLVAEALGLSYSLRKVGAVDFIEKLEDRPDIIMGVFKTKRRAELYDFSVPLYRIGLNGVCKADLPRITEGDLFEGNLRVIVQKGEVGWEYAVAKLGRARSKDNLYIVESPATHEVMDLLLSGKYDLAITDEVSCLTFLNTLGSAHPFRLAFDVPLENFDVCLALSRTRSWPMDRVNYLLVEIRNSSEFLRREVWSLRGFERIIGRLEVR